MTRLLTTVLMTTLIGLSAAPATFAQEKPKSVNPRGALGLSDSKKGAAITRTLSQKVDLAFKGEEKLKEAMLADIAAVKAEKDPQKRAARAKAFNATYQKDVRRLLTKGGIDLNAQARDLQAAYPGMNFTVVNGTQVVGRTVKAQSQPAPPATPTSLDIVKDLVGPDYRVDRESDCSPGWGETTRSGGYMTSKAEGCITQGQMYHDFEVPADKKGRIEITGSLSGEAHVISGVGHGSSRFGIKRLSDEELLEDVSSSALAAMPFIGDDAADNVDGGSIVRNLPSGRYQVFAYTYAYAHGTVGWAEAEGRVKTLRVRIILSPK